MTAGSWTSALVTAAVTATFIAAGSASPRGNSSPATPVEAAQAAQKPQEAPPGRGVPELGLTVHDPDPTGAVRGVVVEQVSPGSPAEQAGFRAGDVVSSFDGETVRSTRQLARLVRETPAGRTVSATVVRDGTNVDVSVTPTIARAVPPGLDLDRLDDRLDELSDRISAAAARARARVRVVARPRLGVEVLELGPQLAGYFGVADGVLVGEVADGTAAAGAGIRAGDVITSVGGRAVRSRGELLREIRTASSDTEIEIGLVRDRQTMSVRVRLQAPPSAAPGDARPPRPGRRLLSL
jgi:S1-C subfamily serine protease